MVDLSDVTMGKLEGLLRETEFFGFPCVLSKDSQLLAGFLTRKDMQYVLGEWRRVGGEGGSGEVTCSMCSVSGGGWGGGGGGSGEDVHVRVCLYDVVHVSSGVAHLHNMYYSDMRAVRTCVCPKTSLKY